MKAKNFEFLVKPTYTFISERARQNVEVSIII